MNRRPGLWSWLVVLRTRGEDPCICEDRLNIADEYTAIVAANPDLAGYGRRLPELYLIPEERS